MEFISSSFFMRSLSIITLLIILSLQTVSATIITPAGITREATTALSTIQSLSWRGWAESRIEYLKKILWTAKTRAIRQEIASTATTLLADIRSGAYTFDISSTERSASEAVVLGYQQELVTIVRDYIHQYNTQDKSERGNMHMTMKLRETMNDSTVTVDVSPYHVSASRDFSSIEIDGKIDIAVLETIDGKKEQSVHIMIDGKIQIIKGELYLMLRNYELSSINHTGQENHNTGDMDEIKMILSEIQGKTYHHTIGDHPLYQKIALALNGDEGSVGSKKLMQQIESILDILMTNPVLTPIAKKWESMVLGINTATLLKVAYKIPDFQKTYATTTIDMDAVATLYAAFPIAADIRLTGRRLSTDGLTATERYSGYIDRTSDGIPVYSLTIEDLTGMSKMTLAKTSATTTLTAHSLIGWDMIDLDMQATKGDIRANLSLGWKVFATAKVHTDGKNAWSYDIEYNKITNDVRAYDGEQILWYLHIWGDLRQEFGVFALTPPPVVSQLMDLQVYKKERDEQRKNDIENIHSNVSDFYNRLSRLPIAPKDNCTKNIRAKTTWNTDMFSYYADPTWLSTATCPNGYYYRILRDYDDEQVYLVAARTETREAANYDNSRVDITRASFRTIMGNVGTGISSADPANWYLITMPYLSSDSIGGVSESILRPSLGCELNGICQ
jgi:hypothetical protein